MPINSRTKGASAERECAKIIFDLLGVEVKRNLDQWRSGGFDLEGLDDWAIEVKRCKKPLIKSWWEQTTVQAKLANKLPVLWYRLDRQSWRVCVPLQVLQGGLEYRENPDWGLEYMVEMSPEAWASVAREML